MATVMEAFDAQMMDYHYDGDIQMQPSHEVWFQDEALMEDDGQQLHGETQSNNTEYQAVEIEMEENYSEIGQNPEYEMVDEATDYPVSGVDEEDIIVADDSHSPEVNVGTVVSFQASSEVLTSASTFPSPHGPHSQLQEAAGPSLDSSQIGGGASDFAEISSAVQTPHTNSATAETHVAPVTEATQSVVDAHNDRTIAGADEERAPVESIDRVGLPIEAGESHESPNKEAPAAESAQPQVNDETYDSGTHSLGEEHGAQDGLLHEARSQGYVGEESTEDHHALLHKSSVSTTITTTSHASAAAAESSQPSEQQEAEVQHDPLVSDSTLEPPPGILLSFPATEQEDACLFTQPNYPESSTAVAHPYRVLFEQSPALYYEPLSTVFEVLRQDQTLASAGDFSHSELVLDAYDLQLTVSEDNIFARETSLYDLHQLHVGSDFSGPLRLRLHTTSPRFIVRYRLLQEQIYRLDLTAQEYEDGGKEPEQYEGQGTAEEPPVEQILQAEGTAEEAHAQELTTTENDVEELGHDYEEEGEGQEQEQEQEEHDDDDDDDSDTLTSNETTEDTHDHHIGQEVREQEERNEEPAVSQDNVSEQGTSEQGADLAEAQTVDLPTNEETETGGDEDETADHQDGSDSGSNHEEGSEAREPTTEKETTLTEEPDPSRNPEEEGTAEEVDNPSSVDEDDLQNVSENGDEDSFGQSDYADDWDDTFEDDGALDTTFEEPEGQEIVAGDSNNTLSSKSSKRSIDEVDGGEGTSEQAPSQLDSPGSKRLRTI